jgi:uncharacterized membrane-anchored protein
MKVANLFNRLWLAMHEVAQLPNRIHVWVFTASLFISTHAMAAGVTGFFTGWKSAFTTLIELILLAGMLVGVGAVLYGLVNLIKKGMGRGEDMEWGKILWPIVGGALATILLYVIQSVVEESGASRSDMGRNR